jgi:hypothetical protein
MNLFFSLLFLCILFYFSRKYAISYHAKQLKVKNLLRAALQWHSASTFGNDVILQAIHASKGDAFLNAARLLMSDNDIEEFHPHLKSLIATIENRQRQCILNLQNNLTTKNLQ